MRKIFEMFWREGAHRDPVRPSMKAAIRSAVKGLAAGEQARTFIAVGIDEGAWREVLGEKELWRAAMAFEAAHTMREFRANRVLQAEAMREWQEFVAKAKAVAAAEGVPWE